MNNELFPIFKKSIDSLIEDEEGNIPGKKLLMIGTMMIILGNLLSMDVLAQHSSHSSHRSHSSHSSHSSGSGGHYSHVSHTSHTSHTSHSQSHSSHASHTSHSNTTTHSNSSYTSEGDVRYRAPDVDSINGLSDSMTVNEPGLRSTNLNLVMQTPASTPNTNAVAPALSVPVGGNEQVTEIGTIHQPPATEKVE